MTGRKSKLLTLSIFQWFWKNIAVVFGITSQSRRNRRRLTKRCNRKVNDTLSNRSINIRRKINSRINDEFKNVSRLSEVPELTILNNNNNNRSLDNSDGDQQQIICILVENQEIAESIIKYASVLKNSRIIDLRELMQFIQTTTNITHEQSCSSFITQSKNARRLKALEFIRIFIQKNKEDFCEYLINEEHLCQQKTLAIYQMIQQFLNVVYQSEHTQKQTTL